MALSAGTAMADTATTATTAVNETKTGFLGDSSKGFSGASIYTATGLQQATVEGFDLRVRDTDIRLPSTRKTSNGTFWLVGLDYTHVFENQFSLGAQFDYYPRKGQIALSMSPGYVFNDQVMSYLRFGWAYVPTTIDQGAGRSSVETKLNAYFGGAGARVNLYRGVFAYAEIRYAKVERLNFTSWADVTVAPGQTLSVPIEGSADTSAVNAFIGLGYRF